MKSGLKGLSRLEDAEGDLDEFAHHGADDDHGDLASGGETIPKGAAPSGFVQGDHGGHVQGLAQAGVAHFERRGLPRTLLPDSCGRGSRPAKAAA